MLTKERKVYIMELIKRDGFVTIRQLMDVLNISRSSVMRDLDELEKDGLIKRERGGASFANSDDLLSRYNELSVPETYTKNQDIKRRICKYAAENIKDGNCIYIDSGTSSIYLLDFIIDKEVDIVTPNTYVLSRIPEDYKGKVYVLGGEFNRKSEICFGPMTLAMMQKFRFDYAFITANGIDFKEEEVYSFNMNYAELKKEAMKRTSHSILLVDSSKFDKKGMCVIAKTNDFNMIYVDELNGKKPKNVKICE